jgi:nitroreductase
MDALDALRTRRSCRKFADREVDPGLVEQVVEAGRLAATARNEQPWEFVAVTDADARGRIASVADHGPFIADAPVCIVVLAADTKYYLEDGSAATQNMLVAAHALGLAACWVAGDKKPYAAQVVEEVGAPKDMHLVSMVALGYAKGDLPEPEKRSLLDLLHWERF